MDIFEWMKNNLMLTIIGAVTLIQFTPIQINPWSWLLNQIKNGLGISDLQKEIDEIKKDARAERVDSWRWNILNYGNSCRNGVLHSKEEWEHTIDQIKKYESECAKNNITNGVIEEETKYLRDLYRERLERNDFL